MVKQEVENHRGPVKKEAEKALRDIMGLGAAKEAKPAVF